MSRQIVVEITGDASKFSRATSQATQSGNKFGGIMSGLAAGAGLGLFNKAADIAGGAIDFLSGSLSAGSDELEALNKAQVIFGKDKTIERWAKGAAESMGLSRTEALQGVGTFGNLFSAMKLGKGPTKDMSMGLVQMASDLASFNNMDPTEVLEKLRAGVTGEAEPLKTLGININEATLKAKAMEMGLSDGTTALTAGQKAQASYALMVEQSSNAQGDFARTSDGAANKGRIMDAKMKDLQATIGKKLQPVFLALLDAGTHVVDFFIEAVEVASPFIGQIANKLSPVIKVLGDIFRTVFPIIANVVKTYLGFVGNYIGVVVKVIKGIVDVVGWVVEHLRGPIKVISNLFSGIATVVMNVFGGIKGVIKGAINGIIGIVNGIIRGINSIQIHFGGGPGGIGAFDFNGLNIGYIGYVMHSGGIVPGSPGSDVPTILQAGEQVIPRSQVGRSGGQTIIINIESFIGSDREIEKFTDRIAMRLRTAPR